MLNRIGAIVDTAVGTLFDVVIGVVGACFGYQYEPRKYDPQADALRRWRRRERKH